MIRAAIIGMGWWGRTIARDLATSSVIRPLLGVDPDPAGRDAATALGMRASESFDAALQAPDVDAVVLCTPHRFHAEQIEQAARAGKHVFCEKPLCLTGGDVRRAIAAVKKAGVTLGIGHERRFEPAMIELRQRFKAGLSRPGCPFDLSLRQHFDRQVGPVGDEAVDAHVQHLVHHPLVVHRPGQHL